MKPKVQKILLFTVILGLVLLGGGYAGYRGYKSVRQAKLVNQARAHLDKSEPKKALLVIRRALAYNNRDVAATRMMADLVENSRSPAAVMWRSRVVDLDPRSTDDRLALARTAMAARDLATATNALEAVDSAGKKTAAYHNVAGAVAVAVNRTAEAEAHFLEAARLEPQNPSPQLNLSVVRLRGTNAQGLAEARRALKEITANPTNSALRCQALRELVGDAMRHRQMESALALSQQLLQETNSVFRDRILRLEALRESRNPQFKSALQTFQREAADEAGKIYELGMWQMVNTTPAETLGWLRSLPVNSQTNLPVPILMAECYTMSRDWKGLNAFVEPQNWAELDFLRHAFKSRALREQDLSGGAKGEWELALKTANTQKSSLVMLLRLAAAWSWRTEGEELLWSIYNRYPDEKWVFGTLNQVLFAAGRTRPLMMLYTQQLKRSPSDLPMKNNLAMTALLLDALEMKPHELAREVYQSAPTNSAYVSTYAFSLHKQEKHGEALKVMETLPLKDLREPSVAGYYGLILKASGNKAKADAYLGWSSQSAMLPEEKKLFDQAKARP
jgi:tetratricopeptide (TPR) repeat protein